MLTAEEVLHKIVHIFELRLKAQSDKNNPILPTWNKGKIALPKYYPGYTEGVENFEHIRVHGEKGVFPEHLFIKAAPNQEEDEFQYTKENYKQTTLPVFTDYVNTISRSFSDPTAGVSYNTEGESDAIVSSGQTFEEYVTHQIPTYGSLDNYVKMVLPTVKTLDAEGVICIKPDRIPTTINDQGEVVVSDTELISPVPIYYNAKQLVGFIEEEFACIELFERSLVFHGNRKAHIGIVYEVYDKNTIWRVKQVGKVTAKTFEVSVLMQHDLGRLPVMKLLGIPKVMDARILYQSPFLFATDILDLVALNSNYLQHSVNNTVFPYRVMLGQPCEFEDPTGAKCNDGIISVTNKEGFTNKNCPKCDGSGLVSRVTRTGQMLLKPSDSMQEGELTGSGKPLEYIAPDVSSLKFLEDKVEKDEMKARRILHINTTSTQVSGREDITATSKALDNKAMLAFIKPIADQIYTIWNFMLTAIGDMRYGNEERERFVLTFPKQFDLETDETILFKIKECISTGMPPTVVSQLIFNYVNSVFGNSVKASAIYKLLLATDRLLSFSNEEILKKQALNEALLWEVVLHDSGINFIQELMQTDSEFLALPFEEQQDALRAKAQAKAAELTPAPTQTPEELAAAAVGAAGGA